MSILGLNRTERRILQRKLKEINEEYLPLLDIYASLNPRDPDRRAEELDYKIAMEKLEGLKIAMAYNAKLSPEEQFALGKLSAKLGNSFIGNDSLPLNERLEVITLDGWQETIRAGLTDMPFALCLAIGAWKKLEAAAETQ